MKKESNHRKGNYLRFLTDDQIQTLHDSTLQVLQSTGVIIEGNKMRNLFAEYGAKVDEDSGTVWIPPSLVEQAIERAPKQVTLYGREEQHKLVLGDERVYTHNLGGSAFIFDPEIGQRRFATKKDTENAARLIDALDNIHACSSLFSPTDIPVKNAHEVEMVDATVRHTCKVLSCTATIKDDVEFIHRIFAVVAGGEDALKEHPRFVLAGSPISPLFFSKDICEVWTLSAQLGLPTAVLPSIQAGGTAPVTFAGALVQVNAELLASLTAIQLVNPFNPVIFKPRFLMMDMRSGSVSWGSAQIGMASACLVQLAGVYGIPVDVYGFCTDAVVMDQQAGYERALNGISPALAGANWLSGAGSLEAGANASFEQLIIDDEIFGMILKVLDVFEINEETIALDVINAVGPKGNYLSERHTAKFAREGEQYHARLGNRLRSEQWVEQGSRDITSVAQERAREILAKHEVNPLDDQVLAELDKILADARKHYAQL